MLDSLVHGIDRGIRSLSEIFHGPVGTYCKLETVDRDALVADDGSLITVLRLEGALRQVGRDEHYTIMKGLTEKLQATLSRPGHCIQVVFEYDPEASEGRIREMLEPSRRTALNLGLNIGPLLENWGQALQRHCAIETCWLVLWTRPTVLAESLRKTALKERITSMSKAPVQPGCQQVSAAVAALHDAHNGFLTGVLDAFRQVDLLTYPLTPHEALRDIRLCIDPEFTSRDWQARITPMALTDTALRAVKPGDKAQKLFDGKGLFMLVSPNGTKAWRFKYQFHGREKLISLGLYPTVSLKDAREYGASALTLMKCARTASGLWPPPCLTSLAITLTG